MGTTVHLFGTDWALTLNFLYTIFVSLIGGVLLFRYTRWVKNYDKVRHATMEARDELNRQRHETLLSELKGNHDLISHKIDSFCREQTKIHKEIDRRFWKHGHIIKQDENGKLLTGDIVIRDIDTGM